MISQHNLRLFCFILYHKLEVHLTFSLDLLFLYINSLTFSSIIISWLCLNIDNIYSKQSFLTLINDGNLPI